MSRIRTALILVAIVTLGVAVVDVGPVNIAKMVYRRAQKVADRQSRWLPAPAETGGVTPSEAERARGFVVFERSILRRVYPSSIPASVPAGDERPDTLRLRATLGEYEAGQLAVHALRDLESLEVLAGPLRDGGNVIDASAIDVRVERFYALELSLRVHNRFGVVPKTLEPASPIDLREGSTRPYWITVHVPAAQRAGIYRGSISIRDSRSSFALPVEVEVLGVALDEAPILLGPLSLSVLRGCTGRRPSREAKILEHADSVFRNVREHGMTTLSLWSGRTANHDDTGRLSVPDLDKALELFARYRFPGPLLYAPVNLLNTNKLGRSNNYRHYEATTAVPLARELAATYTPRAAQLGIAGLILDPIEEPNYALGIDRHDAPDLRQKIARELLGAIKAGGGITAMTCTPETAGVGDGNLDYWLVAYKRFTPKIFERARAAGARVAMYANATLSGNGTSFSRFFFGYWPWATGMAGVMAWTDPATPKRFPVNLDPGRAEGAGRIHERFLGSDGKPVPTIQWELAREGVDDFRYLVTIERLARQARSGDDDARRAAADADAFLDSIRRAVSPDPRHYSFEDPRTLEPIDAFQWRTEDFAERRRQAFELLRRLSEAAGTHSSTVATN